MQLQTRLCHSLLAVALGASAAFAQAFVIEPAALANVRCNGSDIGTPTYGTSGIIFTVCAENIFEAPIEKVYDALLEFSNYSSWNHFVIDITTLDGSAVPAGIAPVGEEVTFITTGLIPGINTTSNEIVSFAEPDVFGNGSVAICGWKYSGILEAEHPNILTDLGNGSTRYVSYESYYGLLAPVEELLLESALEKEFAIQGDNLGTLVES